MPQDVANAVKGSTGIPFKPDDPLPASLCACCPWFRPVPWAGL